MLTTKPTTEVIAAWKQLFETYHTGMNPNRKTGTEVDAYFREKYPYQIFDNSTFRKVVETNIMENEYSRNKLPGGIAPVIKSYRIGDVIIGIDLSSGEFHIESEDISKVVPIYDDLFVYRGLDEDDLHNYFLVAEYIELTQK
jgi:hypothetical protein